LAASGIRYHADEAPHRYSFDVNTTAPGFLIFRMTALLGWTLRGGDGTAEEPLTANGWMLAAHVPAGYSRVTFTYRPANLTLAAWLAAVGALSVLILLRRRGGKRARR
jgi:hypothetical protein